MTGGVGFSRDAGNSLRNNNGLRAKRKPLMNPYSFFKSKKSLANLYGRTYDSNKINSFRMEVLRQKRRSKLVVTALVTISLSALLFLVLYFKIL